MSSPTGFTSTLFRALDSMLLHSWEEMETLGSVRDSSRTGSHQAGPQGLELMQSEWLPP